jgi:hypothetical protein
MAVITWENNLGSTINPIKPASNMAVIGMGKQSICTTSLG